eukprot:CAMPEP_0204907324 /NCGR_PEP_ID=MMETSP1397-20131031/6498_1 /ASSEMBLY_ACC=CAM_ASM_000891 /TAXON_ID=49980 /ORGANISM="Climacostomum Climacostomum virens, Strain Stock W-24" /LENGTH=297 /DNA_ID=CAMNT_0052076429 /DNA_START=17 /DNA_END=907 /DNA_ORIENTATION=+
MSRQSSMSRVEEKQCRICFEGTSSRMPLINPCRCAGSVKFVHEECLKTWLLSQQVELADSECEVCKVKFEMKFVIKAQCAPNEACKAGFAQVLFLPLLIVVLAMLMLIIYILADRLINVVDTDEEKGYTVALIVVCLLSAGVIVLLIVNSLKESMCVKKMANWHIKSQNYPEETPNPTEAPIKDEYSLPAIENTTNFMEQSRPEQSMSSLPRGNPGIVVVPEVTRVRGKRVRTPTVAPGLPSINSANPRVQAFIFSGSRSVSSCNTPIHPNFPSTPPYASVPTRANELLRDRDLSEQ